MSRIAGLNFIWNIVKSWKSKCFILVLLADAFQLLSSALMLVILNRSCFLMLERIKWPSREVFLSLFKIFLNDFCVCLWVTTKLVEHVTCSSLAVMWGTQVLRQWLTWGFQSTFIHFLCTRAHKSLFHQFPNTQMEPCKVHFLWGRVTTL